MPGYIAQNLSKQSSALGDTCEGISLVHAPKAGDAAHEAQNQGKNPTTAKAAVILFHGLTGTIDEVIDLAEFLHARGFDLFVPRLSGHGSIEELRTCHSDKWLADAERCFSSVSARYDAIATVGLSFGSLLALYLAAAHPESVQAVAALSPPLRFRSNLREALLGLLSCLPDVVLDRLGVVQKTKRKEGIFIKERTAFPVHSIAAGARLLQIRRTVLSAIAKLRCPVLLLHDPEDHHLSPEVPSLLRASIAHATFREQLFPGGQHELTIGHSYKEVSTAVADFFDTIFKVEP